MKKEEEEEQYIDDIKSNLKGLINAADSIDRKIENIKSSLLYTSKNNTSIPGKFMYGKKGMSKDYNFIYVYHNGQGPQKQCNIDVPKELCTTIYGIELKIKNKNKNSEDVFLTPSMNNNTNVTDGTYQVKDNGFSFYNPVIEIGHEKENILAQIIFLWLEDGEIEMNGNISMIDAINKAVELHDDLKRKKANNKYHTYKKKYARSETGNNSNTTTEKTQNYLKKMEKRIPLRRSYGGGGNDTHVNGKRNNSMFAGQNKRKRKKTKKGGKRNQKRTRKAQKRRRRTRKH